MELSPKPEIISTRIIVEHDNKIALLRRAQTGEFKGAWELPGGKQDPGETIWQAAGRECEEELGLNIEFLTYNPELLEDKVIDSGKHRGRPYKSYGFMAMAETAKIVLEQPSEHEDYMWIYPADAISLGTLTAVSTKALEKFAPLLRK